VRSYLRDPAAIYAASFATVRAEAALDRFPADVAQLVLRVVHACGMVEIADRIAFAPDVAASGVAALRTGAPVYVDCEMVSAGITRRLLPAKADIRCTLNDPRTPDLAEALGTTRSAAAVDLWETGGAVIAIGNAPTALFRLLERLDEGAPCPAAILAFPVGFVGAAESKAELAANPRKTPHLTLRGRKGGSAMASAAVNALAILAAGGEQ
jgi:precorrin-8X/cobalt-precorrin-8 methylmutase